MSNVLRSSGALAQFAVGIACSIVPVAALAGPPTVAITEFAFNPIGSDGDREWIELYNYGPTDVGLDGWVLADATGTPFTFGAVTIASGDFVVLTRDKAVFEAEWLGGASDARVVDGQSFALNSTSNEELFLMDESNAVVWNLAYDGNQVAAAGDGFSAFLTEVQFPTNAWGDVDNPGINLFGNDPASETLGYEVNSATTDPNAVISTNGDVGSPFAFVLPGDNDGDGVLDESDLCPNTTLGALIDDDGCPLIVNVNTGTAFRCIQDAIDAAAPNDIVTLNAAVYSGPGNVNLDFNGKAMTLRCADGSSCVIDCEDEEGTRGFVFLSGETSDTVVDSVTVINGAMNGEGPTDDRGGAMYLAGGSAPDIMNCRFEENTAITGGALYCQDSSPNIVGCVIINNRATGAAKSGVGGGGGVCNNNSSPFIMNCRFLGNSYGSLTEAGGGGLCNLNGSDPTLIQIIFSGNDSSGVGGAIYNQGSSPTILNSTFSRNMAGQLGGGVFNINESDPTFDNCLLREDSPNEVFDSPGGSASTINFSNVSGGWAGAGSNNISSNAMFVNAIGADFLTGTDDDDLRLMSGSPSIDSAANPVLIAANVISDIDGLPRFFDDTASLDCQQSIGACGVAPLADMGAHEYLPETSICVADFASDETGPNQGGPDGTVDTFDLLLLLDQWGTDGPEADIAGPDGDGPDGVVDTFDLLRVLDQWEVCL